jgi:hypothetical protein
MLLEYISAILWFFALKCCEDCLNILIHCADDWTPYETLAGLESSKINILDFHTFGCPCYVLDQRLQSGNGTVLKREPCAWMGIYVGQSPLHASDIALILNPRTGHISPQLHVVFNDDFTTVPYLCTGTVPPHWADHVLSSATIQMHTEKQVGTWQSVPDIEIDTENLFGKNQPLSTSDQDREGVEGRTVLSSQQQTRTLGIFCGSAWYWKRDQYPYCCVWQFPKSMANANTNQSWFQLIMLLIQNGSSEQTW